MTIVLLPGMDGTGRLFEPFTAALGQAFRVQVVSYPTTGSLGYAELETYVRKRLPVSGHYVVLGESFSGPITVSIAASRPPGVAGVILCSTFVRNPRPAFGPLRYVADVLPVKSAPLSVLGTLLLGRFSTPRLQSMLAEAMAIVSAEALRARLRAVLTVDVSASLRAAVDVPMLYLLAAHDQVVPVSALKDIQRINPAISVASINAPHFLLQATPDDAVRAVRTFMQALQGIPR